LSTSLVVPVGVSNVFSQDFPRKPIRIVASGPGGGVDYTTRLIGQGISGPLGQQVIIDNRGIPGIDMVARSPADGYTLVSWGSALWLAPYLRDKVTYDPVGDFSPITLFVTSPNILVVHPSLPVHSVKELLALAKSKPGALNYSEPAAGGSNHLAAELFKAMAGVNIVDVRYKSTGAALTAVIGGEVQVMFAAAAAVTPYLKPVKLRALAVTTTQPSALAPGLPTVAASGLSGYEALAMFGMFVPAGTPAPIVNRLNQEIVRALNVADVREKLFNSGAEVVGNSPDEFAVIVKADMAKMGKLIKSAGIRAE